MLDGGCMREHAGKVVRIRLGGAAANVRVRSDGSFEAVHPAVEPHAQVDVPPQRLLGCAEPVKAEGDSDFLEACKRTLAEADLAPDALAERWLGPRTGSAVANAATQAGGWGADARRRLASSLRSWLTDEARLVPDPEQVREHERQVREFARRVERLRRTAAGSKAAQQREDS